MKITKREWMNVYSNVEVKQEWRVEKAMCRWGPNFPKNWICTLVRTTETFDDGSVVVGLEICEEEE